MKHYQIIQKPVVTEKSNTLRDAEVSTYVFKVDKKASKTEIKKSFEKIYEVSVAKIRTTVVAGKIKRRGMHLYKKPTYKKAFITLKAGQKLPMFDEY